MANSGLLPAYKSRDRMAAVVARGDGSLCEVRLEAGRWLRVYPLNGATKIYEQHLDVPDSWIPKDITLAASQDGALVVVLGGFVDGSSDGAQNAYMVTDFRVAAAATPSAASFPGAIQPDGRTVINGVDFEGRAVRTRKLQLWDVNERGEIWTRFWEDGTLSGWSFVGKVKEN